MRARAELVRGGHEVIPLVTPGAERFVWPDVPPWRGVRRARIRIPISRAPTCSSSPLTARTLAKLAVGIADSLVTEAALAHEGPVLLAPAMNTRMWNHPATQANVEVLRSRGWS